MNILSPNVIFIALSVVGIVQIIFFLMSVYHGDMIMSVTLGVIGLALGISYLVVVSKDIVRFDE